jgi:hypothetical protein
MAEDNSYKVEYDSYSGNKVMITSNEDRYEDGEWDHIVRIVQEAIDGVTVNGNLEQLIHPDLKPITKVMVVYDFLLSFSF